MNSYMVELNKALKYKALTDFAFRNLSMKTIVDCLFACLLGRLSVSRFKCATKQNVSCCHPINSS